MTLYGKALSTGDEQSTFARLVVERTGNLPE
jgi:hypothetical protein